MTAELSSVLIITNKVDPHADSVIRLLEKNGVSVFRLNTEDSVLSYESALSVSQAGYDFTVSDQHGHRANLNDLKSVWLRKPEFDFAMPPNVGAEVSDFVKSEYVSLINNIYSLPDVLWVNDPFSAYRARNKFQQLIYASQCGLAVPKTLFTDSSTQALDFVAQIDGDIAVKSVYNSNVSVGGLPTVIETQRLSNDEFARFAPSIEICPIQIQEYIQKDYELRITVVGSEIFAVSIDSQSSDLTRTDWRKHTDLCEHSLVELPSYVAKSINSFMDNQNLRYGAIDMIVRDEEYLFLEVNPYGQYLWIEEFTGAPISSAVAGILGTGLRS